MHNYNKYSTENELVKTQTIAEITGGHMTGRETNQVYGEELS